MSSPISRLRGSLTLTATIMRPGIGQITRFRLNWSRFRAGFGPWSLEYGADLPAAPTARRPPAVRWAIAGRPRRRQLGHIRDAVAGLERI